MKAGKRGDVSTGGSTVMDRHLLHISYTLLYGWRNSAPSIDKVIFVIFIRSSWVEEEHRRYIFLLYIVWLSVFFWEISNEMRSCKANPFLGRVGCCCHPQMRMWGRPELRTIPAHPRFRSFSVSVSVSPSSNEPSRHLKLGNTLQWSKGTPYIHYAKRSLFHWSKF